MGEFNSKYHVYEDYEIIFDEKAYSYGTLRKVQWVKEGAKPDKNKAKLEIRKFFVSGEEEKMGKGYTFSTEEGPHELTEGLVENGFGDTKKILRAVRKREDFLDAAKTINEDAEDSSSGEMFDMRDLLLGLDDTEGDE